LRTHNTTRFFTENRTISWILLLAVILWGIYGYLHMPKRKDPDIPVPQAHRSTYAMSSTSPAPTKTHPSI
jgi:multidrug efflux pump subunit AcrB